MRDTGISYSGTVPAMLVPPFAEHKDLLKLQTKGSIHSSLQWGYFEQMFPLILLLLQYQHSDYMIEGNHSFLFLTARRTKLWIFEKSVTKIFLNFRFSMNHLFSKTDSSKSLISSWVGNSYRILFICLKGSKLHFKVKLRYKEKALSKTNE